LAAVDLLPLFMFAALAAGETDLDPPGRTACPGRRIRKKMGV